MSTNINFNQLKTFITRELNIDKLDEKDAKKLAKRLAKRFFTLVWFLLFTTFKV